MNYDGIIFDLDGTLWSTIESCMESIKYVRNKHKEITREITENEVVSSMGLPFDDIVQIYYSYLEKDKAEKYAKEAFNKNIENLMQNGGVPYENMSKTIEELSKYTSLYIVSNCIDGYIESFLNSCNLQKYFKDYESNGRTGLSKGENINLIIERNNLKNPIYVGDTISDKTAADFANIPFVYASYGFGKVEEYDYKIDSIDQILNVLK